MYGLTVAERLGQTPSKPFLDRLAADGVDAMGRPEHYAHRDYLELAIAGGFPEPLLHLRPAARRTWIGSYVEQLVTRDAEDTDVPRDPDRLLACLEAIAVHSAGVVEHKAIYDAARVARMTGSAYETLLRNLLVVHAVPAWLTNRVKRLTRNPTRYLTDVSLLAYLLGVDANSVMRNGKLLGQTLDSFVAAQLRAELPRSTIGPGLHHLRQQEGRHEVGILAEVNGDQLIGIEVKAGAPTTSDAEHLARLRDELGGRFLAGVILHTSPVTCRLGERIMAAPITSLWTE